MSSQPDPPSTPSTVRRGEPRTLICLIVLCPHLLRTHLTREQEEAWVSIWDSPSRGNVKTNCLSNKRYGGNTVPKKGHWGPGFAMDFVVTGFSAHFLCFLRRLWTKPETQAEAQESFQILMKETDFFKNCTHLSEKRTNWLTGSVKLWRGRL